VTKNALRQRSKSSKLPSGRSRPKEQLADEATWAGFVEAMRLLPLTPYQLEYVLAYAMQVHHFDNTDPGSLQRVWYELWRKAEARRRHQLVYHKLSDCLSREHTRQRPART
jgi:hypothetical protein